MCEFLKLYRICFVYGLYQLIKIFLLKVLFRVEIWWSFIVLLWIMKIFKNIDIRSVCVNDGLRMSIFDVIIFD